MFSQAHPWRGRFWRRRLALLGSVALVAIVVLIVGSGSSSRLVPHVAPARAAPQGPPVPLSVGGPMRARPIPPGFLGLSIEYKAIEQYAGRNPYAVNPVLVNLIKGLSPGQRPELRLGGDSTDRTWWPGPGARRPRGAYIKLNTLWGEVVGAVIHATDARTIVG